MKENIMTSLALIILMNSCLHQASDGMVYWVESNAICVHWTDFGKENFDTKAIRIVLKSRDSIMLSSNHFYLSSNVVEGNDIELGKLEKIKKIGLFHHAYLFVRSKDLYKYFPEDGNYYNDDCYSVELANMVGQGQVFMKNGNEEKVIGKSSDYTLSVGPISNTGQKRE